MVGLPNGGLSVLIVDAVDKGVGAALYMAMSCACCAPTPGNTQQPRAGLPGGQPAPAGIYHRPPVRNCILGVAHRSRKRCSTATPATTRLSCFVPTSPTGQQLLRNTGLPLEVSEERRLSKSVHLAPGDVLVLYTDGVTDAESADGDFYDLSRLVETVSKNTGSAAAKLRDAILDDVHSFTCGAVLSRMTWRSWC